MSVTATLHLWWLGAWILAGAALWMPLEALAYRATARPKDPFWRSLWSHLKRRPYFPLIMFTLWPLAVWEELR